MRARGGSIVLMHDGVGGVQTYRALGRILAGLSKRGYVFRALC
jgi:peptidoglycan/xylan/chitin deacetylase (PgdA/CDA1 family)